MKTAQTVPDTKKTAGPPPRRVRPQIIAGGLSPAEVDALIVPDQVRRAPPKVAKLPPPSPQDDRFAWAFEG